MADKGFKRKLTAILSADAVEYSRLMGEDEEATVRILKAYREVLTTLIQQHNGRVLDSPGDNLLAEFASVVDTVQCAVAVQKEIKARNDQLSENRRMQFRIGINLGDVIQEEDRIYGDGVNIAARLEGLSEPGGICISKTAFDHIESKLPYGYDFIGDQTVKNITKPVGAYRVLMEPRVTIAGKSEQEKPARGLRKALLIGAAVVLVLVLVVAVWQFYARYPGVEPASKDKMAYELPGKPSIAVLPFENLSGDPKQEYLSDGISEAIISALSKVPMIFVIARNSSFTYKGKPVKVQQVAEELGVQYVLEGSVQRSGKKLRVTVQLLDALKGHHLWSKRYDLKMDDLLTVQDEIAMNVLAETQVNLTEGEQAILWRRETNNLKAYENFLEGLLYIRRGSPEDIFKARQLAEEARGLDPNFSAGYRLLGWCHLIDAWRGQGKDSSKSFQLATECAQKALALDENSSDNLALWASVQKDPEKAVEILRRAVKINPNLAFVTHSLGVALFNSGKSEEALHYAEKAIRLNPFPPAYYFNFLGMVHYSHGSYEEALDASKKALDLKPDDASTLGDITAIYIGLGQEEKARATAAEVLRLDPNFSVEHAAKILRAGPATDRYVGALQKAGLK
jgi:adenylate cyclase